MLGNADGHATTGEPICRPPSQSPVERPSAIAPSDEKQVPKTGARQDDYLPIHGSKVIVLSLSSVSSISREPRFNWQRPTCPSRRRSSKWRAFHCRRVLWRSSTSRRGTFSFLRTWCSYRGVTAGAGVPTELSGTSSVPERLDFKS